MNYPKYQPDLMADARFETNSLESTKGSTIVVPYGSAVQVELEGCFSLTTLPAELMIYFRIHFVIVRVPGCN
jgi:hypothetical protein